MDVIPANININIDTIKENIGYPLRAPVSTAVCPITNSSPDCWVWNTLASGPKVLIIEDTTAVFHPVWSNSTEGIQGTRTLNGGLYYWEVVFGHRVFGTAMMVGIGTPQARLHSSGFDPIIGEDANSWGLSHKGYIHHNGEHRRYCDPFAENIPTVVGVMFDGGTVTFFKDGVNLGVAFRGLEKVAQDLCPMVSSTAAKTAMQVQNMRRGYRNLQDRCRDVILRNLTEPGNVYSLPLPYNLRRFLLQHSWKTKLPKGYF